MPAPARAPVRAPARWMRRWMRRGPGPRPPVREHRGVSREELQQSALVAVAVLLVLGVVAAWSVLIPGVSAWENIIVALIGSLRITGPVAAAFAAWVAVRRRRATGDRAL